jgi:hypothetical protein
MTARLTAFEIVPGLLGYKELLPGALGPTRSADSASALKIAKTEALAALLASLFVTFAATL